MIIGFLCNQTDSAKILGIIPTAAFSHQIAYMKFWRELSSKGHQVTVLTTDPQKNTSLTNLTEIDLSIGYKFIKEKHNWPEVIMQQTNPYKFLNHMLQMMYEATELYLQLPEVQNLINNKSLHFDLVMVEAVFPEWLIFGEIFNAPTIMLMSLDGTVQIHRMFQNPTHPVVYPEIFVPFVGHLSFTERLISTVLSWSFDYVKSQYMDRRQQIINTYFRNISNSIDTFTNKSSLLFLCVNPVLLLPRPYTPRTIVIGGGTTIQEPRELPSDVKHFLDSSEHGAILFSLGSNVQCEDLGEDTIKGFLKVLGELPYNTLWKFKNKFNYDIPENVKTYDWLFQQDILRHPKVKLFINQAGIQSLEEAIYFSVPIIAIPIYADQENNAKRLQQKGVLKRILLKPELNSTHLKETIVDMMQNKLYIEKMRKLSQFSMDQPMDGIQKAIWWTEYVIRHGGNVEYMINTAASQTPFYQYYLIDVTFNKIKLECKMKQS
ncbi:hypothetical protein GWI33_020643 [Rhynchophorus ferrugineus]|uniref:UDP-glucuronosyltransferase n=1 Tax=Rhynchophorus ferrugineus TaxID=354439 RepID=A0A834HRT6_RHYFE|nr:hypothetical protein GWI33_020643 [Rhynchophorus ferrugineus]